MMPIRQSLRRAALPPAAALALAALLPVCTDAIAADYPTRPVRFIVPFAPGGGVDLIARTAGTPLGEALGQSVVIDNRAGGGGNIGTDLVAKANPDGHTILMGYVGNLAINPFLFSKLPYDPLRDFAPITLAAVSPNLLVAHPSLKAASAKDLVTLSKSGAAGINYASGGTGTVGHMVAELFRTASGASLTHVPYKGNGAAIVDVLAGQVPLIFSAPGAVIGHVRAGRLRTVAIANAQRQPDLPEVPTFVEAGFPDVVATAWYGILAPARTPPAIVARLNRELTRILATKPVVERLATAGYDARTGTPAEFSALLKSDLAKWQKVVKASGARVD